MRLHHSEWLDAAKRVPLGQKRRVYHGAERTAAMDVRNNSDSWSAYCHRCGTSGWYSKGYREKLPERSQVSQKYLGRDTVPIHALQAYPEKYKALVTFLQSKGVSTTVLAELNPVYNLDDNRLVFSTQGVTIGRDVLGAHVAKWYRYYNEGAGEFLYLQGSNPRYVQEREIVYVTEDLFSAQKLRYYTGCTAICALGTRVPDSLLVRLLDKACCATGDGDVGGQKLNGSLRRLCSTHCIPFSVYPVPDGYDPKDLNPFEINKLVEDLVWTSRSY